MRGIVACQGNSVCRYGLIDCQDIARRIDELYFGMAVPKKLKIAVTGCPSACARPQDNDFGIMGTTRPRLMEDNCIGCGACVRTCKMSAISLREGKAKIDVENCLLCGACIAICRKHALVAERTGYTIFVGGNLGRRPRPGMKLIELVAEENLFAILERTVEYYKKEGLEGERLGKLIDRLGLERYKEEVLP